MHAGSVGAGHFSKMVHNGIEYAIMQAYAEGWELLDKVDLVDNVPEVFRSWREGTVIRSWLLDLAVAALDEDPVSKIRGYAEDSGEGRWTVEAGIDNAVATPAITAALYARFVSRQDDSPAMKAVAAMRNQFGGHAVQYPPRPAATRADRDLLYVSHLPCTTSAPTPMSTSTSSRASRRSSAATDRARPTWSRRSTTSPASLPPRREDAPLVRAAASRR